MGAEQKVPMKTNGVLAAALRVEINRLDLPLKQVADMVHRSERTVNKVLAGGHVDARTIAQFEQAFPAAFLPDEQESSQRVRVLS